MNSPEQQCGQARAERLCAWILAHVAALDEHDRITVNFALAGTAISVKLEVIEPVD